MSRLHGGQGRAVHDIEARDPLLDQEFDHAHEQAELAVLQRRSLVLNVLQVVPQVEEGRGPLLGADPTLA